MNSDMPPGWLNHTTHTTSVMRVYATGCFRIPTNHHADTMDAQVDGH